jgi:hypothetical protein
VFDAAEYLDSPEMIAEYLTEAFETDDEVSIAKAIGTVARAQGKPLPCAQRRNPARIRDHPQGAWRSRCATRREAASGMIA